MNTNTITVYAKPACPQCDATQRWLAKHGIAYHTVDLATDPEAREFVLAHGYASAPVVFAGDGDHWAGFRPDRLAQATAAGEESVAG